MKLSRILSVALLGAVAMTSSAMAAGTTAGTTITNKPTLNYSMGNKTITDTKVVATSYVVDKVINLVTVRTADYKQDLAVGESKMVSFTVTNKGNSVENFLLKRFGTRQQFKFSTNKFYVDADNSGVIEAKEKIDTKYIKLAIDTKATVFMEVMTDAKTNLKKINSDGLLVQAVDASFKAYKASKTNNLSKVDVVFADDNGGADAKRDGQYGLYYQWTTVQGGNVKLDVKPLHTGVSADPVNGVCASYKDFMSAKYQAIPGATIAKRWEISNKTKTEAKKIKFSVAIDSKTEVVAKTNKNTWLRFEKTNNIHTIFKVGKGHVSQGVYNSKTNSVDFTIPSIKAGEVYHVMVVTEMK